ncbi:unnamed protein product [Rotaria magnacalcarata]|uniref:Uncharacterized protein n=3 Tax=Rotaria magnacalcarata TaxID=392030 RepID=A0A816V1T1_9BILA|nr:unnamed protein product [Rotaria magnacalcarata]CAF1660320.1 unnamed protein product [Rotaria magnacalcarata]CAF2115924.1 unnamed protein product [Rotaria magnacalcarata]CAF2156581.1 unnamed protein product [Rotaria magnacalcarata]CAF4023679.1 unnamed protein product [Rotaria magnacalcarata]
MASTPPSPLVDIKEFLNNNGFYIPEQYYQRMVTTGLINQIVSLIEDVNREEIRKRKRQDDEHDDKDEDDDDDHDSLIEFLMDHYKIQGSKKKLTYEQL